MRLLVDFVAELRDSGIGVSMVEATDAAEALRHIDILDRSQVRHTLASTLVKTERHLDAFDAVFEAFFATAPPVAGSEEEKARDMADEALVSGWGTGGGGSGDEDALVAALVAAVGTGDEGLLQAVIRRAVTLFSGMEPGRPVGGSYYLYRVARSLDLEGLRERLTAAIPRSSEGVDRSARLQEIDRTIESIRSRVRREITRRLVADRGRREVSRTMRRALVEDIDLTMANRDELVRVEKAVQPLARRLAARLARRRRLGALGRLDVRRTVRRSLSTGGVLIEPRFRRPRPGRPDVVVLTDVSGSVATFARFTLQLVHAVSSQLSRVRSFAFIDAVDEVTPYFEAGVDPATAMRRIAEEAAVVWLDGHSNYGRALGEFVDRYADALSSSTVVIITGDARTNYHEPNVDALRFIAARTRAVYWLNPEHHRYWDTGDSVMAGYAEVCEAVYEVRNLRQLERFVERVALPLNGGSAPGR